MDFRPKSPISGRLFDKKRLFIYAISAVLIVTLFAVGISVTGYVTSKMTDEVEKSQLRLTISDCQDNLSATAGNLSSCMGNLSACRSSLQTVESELADCKSTTGELNATLLNRAAENEELKKLVQDQATKCNSLALNSARAICCTPGLTSANWEISNDAIICAGSQVLNCSA